MEGIGVVVIPAVEGPPAGTPKRIPVRQLGQFHPAKKDYLAKDAARKAAARLLKRAAEAALACGEIDSLPTAKRACRPTKTDGQCTVKYAAGRARAAAAAAATLQWLTMAGGLVPMDCEEVEAQAEEMAARIVASALAAEEEAAKEAKAAELVAAERVAEKAAADLAACKEADEYAKAACVAAAERKAAAKAAAKEAEIKRLAADRGYSEQADNAEPREPAACFFCFMGDPYDSDDHDPAPESYMPCCGHRLHKKCMSDWHGVGRGGGSKVVEYRCDGGTRVVQLKGNTCPICHAERKSARVLAGNW